MPDNEAPALDAYSEVVTRIAAQLTPRVAAVNVSRRRRAAGSRAVRARLWSSPTTPFCSLMLTSSAAAPRVPAFSPTERPRHCASSAPIRSRISPRSCELTDRRLCLPALVTRRS